MDSPRHIATCSNKPPAGLDAPMAQMFKRSQKGLYAQMHSDLKRKEEVEGRLIEPKSHLTKNKKSRRRVPLTLTDGQKELARRTLGLTRVDNENTLANTKVAYSLQGEAVVLARTNCPRIPPSASSPVPNPPIVPAAIPMDALADAPPAPVVRPKEGTEASSSSSASLSSTPLPGQAPTAVPAVPAAVPNTAYLVDVARKTTLHLLQSGNESLLEDTQAFRTHAQWSQAPGQAVEESSIRAPTPSRAQTPFFNPPNIPNLTSLVDLATRATTRLLRKDRESLQEDIETLDEYARWMQVSGQPVEKLEKQTAEKQEWKDMLRVHTDCFLYQAQAYRSVLASRRPLTAEAARRS